MATDEEDKAELDLAFDRPDFLARNKSKATRSRFLNLQQRGTDYVATGGSFGPFTLPTFKVNPEILTKTLSQFSQAIKAERDALTREKNASSHSQGVAQLIGRSLMTRWPDDGIFYKAVIIDYNPIKGEHLLAYDIGTSKETWEWLNLKPIPPEDIRWEGDDPGIARRGVNNSLSLGGTPCAGRDSGEDYVVDPKILTETFSQFSQAIKAERDALTREKNASSHSQGVAQSMLPSPAAAKRRNPRAGRGRGVANELPQLQNGVGKVSDEIEILHTETLLKEVEIVLGASQPDIHEIAKAKKMLKEHEQALIDVIQKLADSSDSGSDGEPQISHVQLRMDGGQRSMHQS